MIGLPVKFFKKSSSVQFIISLSKLQCNGASCKRFLFQGHTSWQISHPKTYPLSFIAFSTNAFFSERLLFAFSIVRYEIHKLQSITFGWINAFVGHASIHKLQEPQRLGTLVSGSISIFRKITAK